MQPGDGRKAEPDESGSPLAEDGDTSGAVTRIFPGPPSAAAFWRDIGQPSASAEGIIHWRKAGLDRHVIAYLDRGLKCLILTGL